MKKLIAVLWQHAVRLNAIGAEKKSPVRNMKQRV